MRSAEEIRADLAHVDRDGMPWPAAAKRLLEDMPEVLDKLEQTREREKKAMFDILAICAPLMWATSGTWGSVLHQVQELARRANL